MKKLFVIALAAVGMVACVNDEIVETPQGNAISFDNAFIDNATRAELTAANLDAFKVWGYIDADGTQVSLFEGDEVSKATGDWAYEGGARYWAPGMQHYFQAIAPLTTAVAAEHADGEVTAINYTVDGDSDLIYAAYDKVGAAAGSTNGPVSFTFGHLLSKVEFEFVNGFAAEDGVTIAVKNVKMTVPAKGKYDIATGKWAVDTTVAGKTLENIEGSKFVLPYDNSYAYAIEFDVDVTYGGVEINKDVHKTSSVMVALNKGTAYKFTATINAETLNMESIDFEVGQVDGWVVGGESTLGTAYISTAAALQAALNNPGVDTIVLTEDVTLTETLTVDAISRTRAAVEPVAVTLDLNGNTISGNWAKADGAVINVAEGAAFNLSNGTVSSTGKNGGSAILNYGTTTLDDVTINGAEFEAPGWPSYGVNNFGTLTVNGATINTYHGAIATGGDGVTVIEDATVDVGQSTETNQTSWALYVYENGQLTVNGGTFSNTKDEKGEVYGGGYICTSSTKETIINGGTFDKTEGNNNGSGFYYNNQNLVIKGGTFDVNPPATYLADGYTAVDNGDGTWSVVKALNSSTISTVFENLSTTEPTTIAVTEDINVSEPLTIPAGAEVTVQLGDKEITSATTDGFVVNEGATLTISGNGTVKSNGAPIRAIGGTVIVEGGTFTQTGAWNTATSTYRYSVDSREGGEVIIKGGTFNTNNGLISVSANSSVVIDGGEFTFENNTGGTRHFAYVSGVLTINDGVFRGVADSGAGGCFFCGAASTCDIQVNGGKFTSLWTSGSVNKIFESYAGGSEITVTGGLFNSNGGITDFVEANTDAATMAEYPYVANS